VSLDERHEMSMPVHQNAVDLFQNEWVSKLPNYTSGGDADLYDDGRLNDIEKVIGSFAGLDILELGPLEAGHSFMMESRGANSILSIESNTRAYMKCLVAKEIFNLKNTRFLLGDFNKYLKDQSDKFDLILALGVIYHMENPVETLAEIFRCTDRVAIWSHFYDESIGSDSRLRRALRGKSKVLSSGDFSQKCYQYNYGRKSRLPVNRRWPWLHIQKTSLPFLGAAGRYAYWLPMDGWLRVCEHFGFDLEIISQNLDHPNGPQFTAVATRH